MSISRREILRIIPAAAAGFLAGRNAINRQSLAAAPLSVEREYGGSILCHWELALGDALYNPPVEPLVSLCDIELVHHISCPEHTYSELLANVNRRVIMAHAISFYRVIDETALSFVHSCGYKFRLPYIPQADVNSEENGQTIEGGIFVWDGGQTRLDYGMAFQWIVNPWAESGRLNAWTSDGWVQVGELPLASESLKWHEVRMVVDYPSQDTQLYIDETQYQSYLAATPKTGWGTETAARLQAEVVSVWPEPADMRAMHRAEFKDWYWSWSWPYKAYMPLVLKASAL